MDYHKIGWSGNPPLVAPEYLDPDATPIIALHFFGIVAEVPPVDEPPAAEDRRAA